MVEALVGSDLALLGDDPACLPVVELASLAPARQRTLVRYACRRLGLASPPSARLETLLIQLNARDDAQARVDWADVEARIWRGKLYLQRRTAALPAEWRVEWQGEEPLPTPWGNVTVALAPTDGHSVWLVLMPRRGGERLRLAGRGARDLKRLLQEAGVPPWARERLAVAWHEEEPVAALLLPEGRWLAVAAGWRAQPAA